MVFTNFEIFIIEWIIASLHHRWEDLQDLFGIMEPVRRNETENEHIIRRHSSALINYTSNPNIVYALFVRRLKLFVSFSSEKIV